MIPKKVHYIWLGGNKLSPLSMMVKNSWKRNLPEYEIIEWNENNLPINELRKKNKFFDECCKRNLWAFMSDYLRLWILYNYGGIYMDTDVEVVKSMDKLLINKSFFGFESGNEALGEYIGTGVIGSEKGNKTIKYLLDFYNQGIWEDDEYVNTILLKKIYLRNKNVFKEAKSILVQHSLHILHMII
ncbi:glycosyltransferase family 32 protein [Ligilactobacillus equi]|uniref:glycosyltransferase family 32 protein n=1 Tax=Ligilactobacillus equi TaxID=137357 RepID=UPI000685BE98|nr:glycosyltransferase [Ligilactobacillus equi]